MDFAYYLEITQYILMGSGVTLQIFAVTLLFSIPLGILCALGKLTKFKPLHLLLGLYTWVFRGTPLLLQLCFVYYGLPIITNQAISLMPIHAAFITFIFNYGAYLTEIFRAGIQSIGKGQYEASKALGMSPWITMRRIVLPQAVKVIIPPLGNETINLIKDTALCSVITVTEMLRNANRILSKDFNIMALVIAALIYLAFTFIIIQIFRHIEKKYSYYTIK